MAQIKSLLIPAEEYTLEHFILPGFRILLHQSDCVIVFTHSGYYLAQMVQLGFVGAIVSSVDSRESNSEFLKELIKVKSLD